MRSLKKKRNPIIPKSVCDVAKNNFPCNYEFELLLKEFVLRSTCGLVKKRNLIIPKSVCDVAKNNFPIGRFSNLTWTSSLKLIFPFYYLFEIY